MKLIKKSNINFICWVTRVMAKGYSLKEAARIVSNILADYRVNPTGLRLEQRFDMILSKNEWDSGVKYHFNRSSL